MPSMKLARPDISGWSDNSLIVNNQISLATITKVDCVSIWKFVLESL